MSKYFIFTIALLSIIISYPIQTNAESKPVYKVANAKSGLNLRDVNCKKIGSVKYNELFTVSSNKTINCKINGENIKMINVEQVVAGNKNTSPVFVAAKYTSDSLQGIPKISDGKVTVNAVGGLNLREERTCKRIMTVKNGTVLNLPAEGMGGSGNYCNIGNKSYSMIPVVYKGKTYWVATSFLK